MANEDRVPWKMFPIRKQTNPFDEISFEEEDCNGDCENCPFYTGENFHGTSTCIDDCRTCLDKTACIWYKE